MNYREEVQKGMQLLADDPRTIFVGQAMEHKGHAVTGQVKDFPADQLLEFPVAEEFQAGFCNGLALTKEFIPVSIYPRCNFGILACNQIVNHLDKWPMMMAEDWANNYLHVIIKMVVGSEYPLDPGQQHKANYAQAFRNMCDWIYIRELIKPHEVVPAYKQALEYPGPTIIIEHGDLY